jgi:hypothetical protein
MTQAPVYQTLFPPHPARLLSPSRVRITQTCQPAGKQKAMKGLKLLLENRGLKTLQNWRQAAAAGQISPCVILGNKQKRKGGRVLSLRGKNSGLFRVLSATGQVSLRGRTL